MDGATLTYGGTVRPRSEWGSLVELLRARARSETGRTLYTFLSEDLSPERSTTYDGLDRRACAVGAWLQGAGAAGRRVLLLFPPGLDYVSAFFGCLYAGAVAVPAYPPGRSRNVNRLRAIVRDASPAVVLTTQAVLSKMERRFEQEPDLKSLRWAAVESIDEGWAVQWKEPSLGGDTLAFLQYTSGSTADPKGVMVTHANLLHNERLIQRAFGQTAESVIVGWLPLFHDMGLIGNVLQPLYVGARCVLLSPMSFLQRPERWLEAISRHRATTSGGPNFAYDFCVRKVGPERREGLDLSSWEVAFNGAEPVRAETLERFADAFEPCGFRRRAFFPCYGLAEATLFVSGGPRRAEPRVRAFERASLEQNRAVPAAPEGEEARRLVGCGAAPRGRVRIVDPETLKACEAGGVGEVWVSGRSVAGGYWNRDEESEQTFRARTADTGEGPYLRTGDLGFVADGQLFITGRLKDLVIIRGRNFYPDDIELAAGRCDDALRPGEGAAFSVEVAGEERLVVVHEVVRGARGEGLEAVAENIRRALAEEYDLQLHAVALIKPGTLFRTSSGKVQRQATKKAFLEGGLEVLLRRSLSDAPAAESAATSAFSTEDAEGPEAVREWIATKAAAVLGLTRERLDVDEPLARYGLDSLAAIELSHAVESNFGASPPATALMQGLSISEVASSVRGAAAAQLAARPAATTSDTPRESSFPLSHGQAALWFLHRLAPETAAYNVIGAARVLGDLDAEALKDSFRALAARHPQLRSRFAARGGEPVQTIDEEAELFFNEENLSGLSGEDFDRRVREEARRPFDLERGPVFRVHLFGAPGGGRLLLIAAHHIVIDLWSLAVLVKDLGALYAARESGAAAALPALQLGYADYVRVQRELLGGPLGSELSEFWRGRLSGELPVLNLAADRPRPSVQTYEGGTESITITGEVVDGIQALARRNLTTPYTVLLAAYYVFLHRHTGQDDLVVGSPTSGRGDRRLESLVGYFVNPVPVRVSVGGAQTFRQFLARVRETVLAAFEHQDYPFPLLVNELCPDRDPSRSPVFQTSFVFEQAPTFSDPSLSAFVLGEEGARLRLGALELESVRVDQGIAQFDLSMVVAPAGGGLTVALQYNKDLFEPSTVARMLERFGLLVGGVVAHPESKISELPVLPEEERRALLRFNETGRPHPADDCLHRLFEEQAGETPEAVALVCGGVELSYRELNERANRLAHHLRSLGVAPEARVALLLRRTPELIVSMLAVLKAGGAYLPLDPAYPAERLSFMLEDAGAAVLICEPGLADTLPAGAARVVIPESHAGLIARCRDDNPRPTPAASNLSHVIYTSGSTGQPKGVAIEHGCVVNFLHWAAATFSAEELSCVLASTSVCFDLSVFEIFAPLSCGGSVVLADDALHLATHPAAGRVTLINTVPSAMAELLRLKAAGDSVLAVNLAGEALKNSLSQQVYANTSARRLLNLYGPTEYTTYTTGAEVERGGEREPTIGRPIDNTQVYVVDEAGGQAPVGVVGELCVGGRGLARGYVNRPALTAERFVPDNLSGKPGARLYRTGDVGRYLESGDIEYLGRKDHQVKIRGYRIELGEIEAALLRYPGVKEVVVVAGEDRGGEKQINAYFIPEQGQAVGVGELRDYLRQTLPAHMTPQTFTRLDVMPLTRNGKVDRKALPAPDPAASAAPGEAVRPGTPLEEVLAGVWCDVLGLEGVGAEDNFFDIGGHSLKAVQVASRLSDLLRVELPVRAVFEAPTVRSLAGVVEQALKLEPGAARPPIERTARDGRLPLSYGQQRLWFLDRLTPGGNAYNLPAELPLDGDLDAHALAQALSEVVRRHEALRTTFALSGDEPTQLIHPPAPVPLPLVDLSALPEPDRLAATRRLRDESALRPFDLSAGPLLRAALLRLGEGRHLFLLCMHHAVSDGWSTAVLLSEMRTLYSEFRAGRPSPLEELRVQYADYARWQRGWLQGEALANEVSYWKRKLDGAPTLLELETDRPRRQARAAGGAQASVVFTPGLSRSLREFGRREGATLFMTLMAGFQALLHRYTGQGEVLVGTPVAGRGRVELEPLVGFFVNMIAVRGGFGGRPSFRELVRQVRGTSLEAYAHQELPFDKLVEELQPRRAPGRNPIFQVVFLLQDVQPPTPDIGALSTPSNIITSTDAKFDLELHLTDTPDGVRGSFFYNAELFDGASVMRMAEHFTRLLERALEAPDAELSTLPLLGERERRRLVDEWNDTESPIPDLCLHEEFERQAALRPDAVALEFAEEQLTYDGLNRRADAVAHELRLRGVGPEVMVGVMLERSADLIVSLLAVSKAGGAYVPVNLTDPPARIRHVIEDAGVRVLLASRGLTAELYEGGPEVVFIDDEGAPSLDASAAAARGEVPSGAAATADNVAYMMYTSGSTGEPKGVCVTHRNVLGLVKRADYAHLGPGEVFMQFAPASFDASTFEVWGCLLNGGRLVVFPPGMPSLRELGEFVNRAQITTMWLTSGLFNQLVDENVGRLGSLRQLLTGGDVVSRAHANRALEQLGDFRLINGYGPTESTTFACCHPIAEDRDATSVPIGRPISNRRVYVVSGSQPAGVGERGELYIGGAGLARGYHNRSDLTAERFLPDPFGARPGGRLYRTGDVARYTDDGVVEFLGRVDDQVKISGFRIEPGEVEAVLLRHPAVSAAAVLVKEFSAGDKRLAAYVVAGDGEQAPGGEELKGFVRERLPGYMTPSAVVFLSELPLTANGKVDRRALPDPAGLSAQVANAFEPPQTQEEQLLAAIWAQVLGAERVGRFEDFFALGGHSLLAIRIVSRVRESFGVELSVRSLFESPTVAGLAEVIRAAKRSGVAEEAAPPLRPLDAGVAPPLSYAQQRLWFLDQLTPGGAEYNIPFGLHLAGRLNVAACEQSCGEIVRRHEPLRTNFDAPEGQAVQVIAPARTLRLKVVDLARLPRPAREAAARRLAEAEARRPFDLTREPLLRVTLLRLGREEHVLLVVMHHIISDGWSIGVFSRELVSLYGAFGRGEASPLAEGALRYADYAAWQREWLRGERLAGQMSYWREQLSGAPAVLELHTDRPRPPVQSFRGAAVPVSLAGGPTEGLKALCRELAVTPFMVMAAAFMLLLSRYSRQPDVSVGTPVAGRTRLETEELIGLFVNTLVLRARFDEGLTLRGLLEQVREVTLQAHAHQDVPFEKLVDELQPERSLSYTPLFQVMFALQNTPAEGVEVGGLKLAAVEVESETAQFDLTLRMEERGGGFAGALNYNTDVFDRETAEQMSRHFERLVGELVRDAGQTAAEVELLGAGERERLLVGWNATDRDYRGARRMHELFEEQAARSPEAPAVVGTDGALTYKELNERADLIARRLRGLGVGPESVVGIYLERSAEMIAALLGVLKSGGAYLPLDTEYPKQRVAFMLEDARPAALLTRGGLKAGLPETEAHVVCLDADPRESAREGAENPHPAGAGDNLAYVIYTSGSTGTPKGVAITHGSAVTLIRWAEEEFGAEALGRVLASTSICFDLSVFEIFVPLSCGGCVVVAGSALDLLAEDGLAGTRFENVTLVNTVPSAMAELVRAGRVPATARVVNLAGEPLKRALADAVYSAGPVERLYNLYGPSEDTTYSTVSLVGRDTAAEPTIGRPVVNTRAYVLDARMRPAPVGVPGELYLGGEGLARGYLGRPALTAERFVPDPFSPAPGGRLYRTGDLCCRLRDGELEFLGRADNQIKLRGFRIELGEVEAAMAAFSGVRGAAAAVREDESGHKHLVGYVAADGEPRADELRAHLRTRLPSYMIPATLVWLGQLPLSPNGKIDRKALPDPVRAAGAENYAAPATRAEKLLAAVWEEVLKVERVGVGDNYFDLGGDSILSIHVAARARREGLVITPRQIFQHQTLGALALAAVESAAGAGTPAEGGGAGAEDARGVGASDFPSVGLDREEVAALLTAADVDEVEDVYPLSPYQQGLLFHVLNSPDAGIYLNQQRYTLRGALDVAAFESAYRALVGRHQVLRTSVALSSKRGPLQVVHRSPKLPWDVYDWRALPPAEASARLEALLRDDYERGFDISSAPLMRATLVRREDDLYDFISTFHLLVMDGSSTPVMFRELLAFYQSQLTGEPAALEPPIRYGDYINWLRGQGQGEAEAYWREALAGFTAPTPLGFDRVPPPGADEQRGYGAKSLALDETATAALRSFAALRKLTLNTLVQGAWALILSRRGGTDDVVFGGVVSGRAADFPGVESAVGVFLNTLPVRVRIPADGAVAPWLAALQERQAEARRFEHCSLVSIQGWSEVPRGLRLYESVLVFQNIPLEYGLAESVGLKVSDVSSTERTHIPLALVAEPGERLNLRIVYQRSRFDDATVERVLENLQRLLAETANDPEATFSSLAAAVAAAERRAIIDSFSSSLASL
jgi:amino acid adenylation domain-containing protein